MGFKCNVLFAIFVYLFPEGKAGREGHCVSDDFATYQYYSEKSALDVTITEKRSMPFFHLSVPDVIILDLNFPVRPMWLSIAMPIPDQGVLKNGLLYERGG